MKYECTYHVCDFVQGDELNDSLTCLILWSFFLQRNSKFIRWLDVTLRLFRQRQNWCVPRLIFNVDFVYNFLVEHSKVPNHPVRHFSCLFVEVFIDWIDIAVWRTHHTVQSRIPTLSFHQWLNIFALKPKCNTIIKMSSKQYWQHA